MGRTKRRKLPADSAGNATTPVRKSPRISTGQNQKDSEKEKGKKRKTNADIVPNPSPHNVLIF